ncbi:hypothetical protein [Flavobacterium phycosphaerae]|uniref:hypothetical protein n=1 Tax=Flavobacterium phycosphaerae TaxID=2697515 RepID=UPI001F1D8F21|nr:hypothetical protein [Flavobacterium phycosphaerae]
MIETNNVPLLFSSSHPSSGNCFTAIAVAHYKKTYFWKNSGWDLDWIDLLDCFAMYRKICDFQKEIEKEDIYGDYVIDRDKFAGKQADWQYNHYRFTITKDNQILFYITNKERIVKTIKGKAEIKEYYTPSPRLKLIFEEPKFHIIADNPALYREIWSFYYVFYSDKYQNVFFKKGTWHSID